MKRIEVMVVRYQCEFCASNFDSSTLAGLHETDCCKHVNRVYTLLKGTISWLCPKCGFGEVRNCDFIPQDLLTKLFERCRP